MSPKQQQRSLPSLHLCPSSMTCTVHCTLYTPAVLCSGHYTLLCQTEQGKHRFSCVNATFLLLQCDISTVSTRHFHCVNASFRLRHRDISTASTRHFYCVNATFLLRQRDFSTVSTRHFYCINATFLLRQRDICSARQATTEATFFGESERDLTGLRFELSV